MSQLGYVLRRSLEIIPILLLVVVLNFLFINLAPGDPAVILSGEYGGGDPKVIEAMRAKYGLDRPLQERFIRYLLALSRGDLGYSYAYNRPVISVLLDRLAPTLLLVMSSIVLAIAVGTFLGAYAAKCHGSSIDVALSVVSIFFYSVPVFWLGVMLVLIFAINLHWFPTSGVMSVTEVSGWGAFLDRLRHLVLPVLTLTLSSLAQYLRVARSSVIEVMREDFITTVRAVGFSENRVFFKYALRNALLPVITVAGLELGFVLGGAVLTETVFGWPGLGREIFRAVSTRDYPVLLGGYLLGALTVAITIVLTDIAYTYLDPRVTYR